MNKLAKFSAFLVCMMMLPNFSVIAEETFTVNADTWVRKGYQDAQIIYKIPKGTQLNLKTQNNNWYNVSYSPYGKEIAGWISREQPQQNNNTTPSTTTPAQTQTEVPEGGGLTLEQQAYLRDYTYTYVNKINSMGVYKYSTYHDVNDNSYELKMTNGNMWHDCAAFCASMLHQTVGAPLNGETVDGKTYKPTVMYATGFANPNGNGKEVFFNIGSESYLEPGDVITCAGYRTHAVLYLGYNSTTGYHEVAESGGKLRLTKLVRGTSVDGEKMTLGQLRSRTNYGEASRILHSVLPKNWTRPSSIVINITNVER